MKLRPQTIIGGVLLLVAELLAGKMSFYAFKNTWYFISNFYVEDIGWLFANAVYSLVSILGILAAIFAFINQSKFSLFLGLGAVLAWVLSAIFWIFAQINQEGSYYIGTAIQSVTLGWSGPEIWVKLGALPTFITLLIAAILIFTGRKPALADQFASRNYYQPNQLYQPPAAMPAMPAMPAAPQQVGMKSCPECAEMIQANAVKCRFCNYRYQ